MVELKSGFPFFPIGRSAKTLTVLLALAGVGLPAKSAAQTSTASINGIVKDQSGQSVPGAAVVLNNIATGVAQTTETNSAGQYVLLNIPSGSYTLRVSKTGFRTTYQSQFSLDVNQTTTFDFTLSVGATVQTISVKAVAAQLQTSSSNLGTAITSSEVNNLPLNGRNFTQLLALTPGVSTMNTSQNAGGFDTNPTGVFVIPSVNGQTNRSDFFMLDGLNDQEVFSSTYTIAPIVDDIQEFKVVSHTDSAEFGGVLGGIINVVTKSGTNQLHGAAWEYLRNNALDARNPFLADTSPLHQNQFGANVGGPVILPHLYNGRNRTFFFGSYEGDRIHTTATALSTIPTPQEMEGDFSDLIGSNGQMIPIYNPFSTYSNPANPGQLLRDPFPGNIIPTRDLDPHMVALAKLIYPKPMDTGIAGVNYEQSTPTSQDTDEYSIRADEQLGAKNSFWFRFTHLNAPLTSVGGLPGLESETSYHAYQTGGSWTHTFGPSAVLQVQFGRNYGITASSTTDSLVSGDQIAQSAGFSQPFACGFGAGPEGCYPGVDISGYTGFELGYQSTVLSDIWQANATMSKIHGHHTISFGATINKNGFQSPLDSADVAFNSFQTSDLVNSEGGSSAASFLLGVPDSASRRQVFETLHGGWVNGFFFQDSWKATDRLTINMGGRYDYTTMPWYGLKSDQSWIVGDYDLNNGTYILEHSAPACSTTVFAPCIPGGTLPQHVVVSPDGKILHTTYDNIQPRLGIAYRLGDKTVIRVAGGRFFDNWAAVNQTGQAFEGSWPGTGQLIATNLNQGLPNVQAENPFSTTPGNYPAPTPFTQVNWFINPLIQNPESWQWNAGIQRELGLNTLLTVNYVGSADTRTDVGGPYNVAVTPGPGDPQSRAPYPYITPTYYDRSIGRATYHALQFSLDHKGSGLSYLISYTYSKAEDLGSDGWYGADGGNVQNPYDLSNDWSVAGYDVPNALSASVSYQLPVGRGQRLSTGNNTLDYVVGNWQVNGILTLTSGFPYTISAPADIPNTGNAWERGDQIGTKVSISNPSPAEWFNTAAFVSPTEYTFGNVGRNSLRSDWVRDVDFSIFREFPLSENKRFEFRAEAFNATNWPVWGFPDATTSDQNFGRIFSTENSPRELQFALKFYW